ncbi:hypothetical protein ACCI51_13445 [Microbulbifer echini]|uniref:Uncharacterized protein n=1 Tax=Microbulbifer echini TaxID=1529067 RepID=A0ABV4NQ88_9GAMM
MTGAPFYCTIIDHGQSEGVGYANFQGVFKDWCVFAYIFDRQDSLKRNEIFSTIDDPIEIKSNCTTIMEDEHEVIAIF